jgi:hypothetical protein
MLDLSEKRIRACASRQDGVLEGEVLPHPCCCHRFWGCFFAFAFAPATGRCLAPGRS